MTVHFEREQQNVVELEQEKPSSHKNVAHAATNREKQTHVEEVSGRVFVLSLLWKKKLNQGLACAPPASSSSSFVCRSTV